MAGNGAGLELGSLYLNSLREFGFDVEEKGSGLYRVGGKDRHGNPFEEYLGPEDTRGLGSAKLARLMDVAKEREISMNSSRVRHSL